MIDTQYLKDKFGEYTNIFMDILPNIILSIFIFIIFYVIAEYFISFMKKPKNVFNSEQETILDTDYQNNNLINNEINWILYYTIIVFGIILALVNLGFNVATIITVLASVGLALGLAFQETLKNMISGIYIAITRLYNIGDTISIRPPFNDITTSGRVIDFNLYYTTIIDKFNNLTIIPNFVIQNNILTNLSSLQK
jgi:small conductance mechanosensitive channel